jgi:hypothetical protein
MRPRRADVSPAPRYSSSARSMGVTRSGSATMSMPTRGSENEPYPCICATAAYALQ